MNKIYLPIVHSTNQYLKENYLLFESPTMVYTFHQTNGYGRWNRHWESKNQENIACSFLIKPTFSEEKLSLFSLFCSLVTVSFLREWSIEAKIKWPNDIIVNNKKIAGILIETIYTNQLDAIIVGIGVNINSNSFQFENSQYATSMFLETKRLFSLQEAIEKLAASMEKAYPLFLKNPTYFLNEYQQLHLLSGQSILFENETYQIDKIQNDGSLLLKGKLNNQIITSGEITFHDGYNIIIK